jgi:hypothetical protein
LIRSDNRQLRRALLQDITERAECCIVRSYLDGRRGWTTVGTLSAALVLLVTGQLYAGTAAAAAGDAAPAPVSTGLQALVSLSVTGAPVAEPTLEALATVDAEAARAERARIAEAERRAAEAAARAEAERQAAEAAVRAEAARQAAEAAARAEAARQAAAAVATAAPAAVGSGSCSGAGWQQRRGEAALASLGPGAHASGFRVEFAPARSGYMGLTHLSRRVVEVFVRDCGTQSDELLRHVIAHELGHAYDTVHMTDAAREAFKAARGIPAGTPWYGCSGCSDFATPAGDFAEVYAQWLRGASSNRSQLAGAPGRAELQALAQRFFGT